MNIEQLIARRGNNKILNPIRDEQLKTAMEFEAKSSAIKAMVKSQGWKAVKEYIDKDLKLLSDSLKILNPADVETMRNVQADIRAEEKLLSLIKNLSQ